MDYIGVNGLSNISASFLLHCREIEDPFRIVPFYRIIKQRLGIWESLNLGIFEK